MGPASTETSGYDEEREEASPELTDLNVEDLLARYANGVRDFHGSFLRGADLTGVALPGCDFTDCDFSGANGEGANFSDGILAGANFREAYLRNAVFQRCNLKETLFTSANLNGADLSNSDLSDADFRGAGLVETNILGTMRSVATDFRFADVSQLVCDGNLVAEVRQREVYAGGESQWGVRAYRSIVTLVLAMIFGTVAIGVSKSLRLGEGASQLIGLTTFVIVFVIRGRRRS